MRPLTEVAISGYRSIVDLHFKVKQINVICGPNGSGKSNLYKALRLLAFTGTGGLGKNLLREGGMDSILWAGDRKKGPVRIRLVACSDTLNYEISLGLPSVIASFNRFPMDPEVKEEFIWHGSPRRPGNTYFERSSSGCWILNERGQRSPFPGKLWTVESVLSQLKEPHLYPELSVMSREFQEWRFYDFFGPIRNLPFGNRSLLVAPQSSLTMVWIWRRHLRPSKKPVMVRLFRILCSRCFQAGAYWYEAKGRIDGSRWNCQEFDDHSTSPNFLTVLFVTFVC